MGFAILHGIMQSFLGDSEQAQRDISRQMPGYIALGELDAYLVLPGELAAEGLMAATTPRQSRVEECNWCDRD